MWQNWDCPVLLTYFMVPSIFVLLLLLCFYVSDSLSHSCAWTLSGLICTTQFEPVSLKTRLGVFYSPWSLVESHFFPLLLKHVWVYPLKTTNMVQSVCNQTESNWTWKLHTHTWIWERWTICRFVGGAQKGLLISRSRYKPKIFLPVQSGCVVVKGRAKGAPDMILSSQWDSLLDHTNSQVFRPTQSDLSSGDLHIVWLTEREKIYVCSYQVALQLWGNWSCQLWCSESQDREAGCSSALHVTEVVW